jgi:hypothetical protein
MLMDPALWAGGGMCGYTVECPRTMREALGNTYHALRGVGHCDTILPRISGR